MNIKQMIARQKELLEAARAENRAMTEDERAEFDSLQRAIEAIDANTEAEGSEGNDDDTRSLEGINAAVEAERARTREIEDMCEHFNIPSREYVSAGMSVDAARAAIIDQLMKSNAPVIARSESTEATGEENFRAAAAEGLAMRAGITISKPVEGAQQLRGMSLKDLAKECLSREGHSEKSLRRMSSDEILTELTRSYFNPGAAFPAIMDSAINKSIVELYNKVPTTFQQFTTKGTLNDFKESSDHEYVIGGVGDFLKVPENGEIKSDIPQTELLPTRKLDTYGKQFSMTRQAFINDDIGFITRVPGLYAAKAKQTIDKQVYSLLYNNAAIYDGAALFSTNHKNLIATGSAPTQASIQEMILKMQEQKDQFGDAIYITPKTIVVPVGYEFDLAVIFRSTQVTGSDHNDINPLYNYPLQIVQSPVLNVLAEGGTKKWFMVADEASARGIQVDYLNGQETPTVRRMEQPGVLGFTWDIFLDWGISVRDFRGIACNPGV